MVSSLFISALSVSGAIFLILEMYGPYAGVIQISSAPLRAASRILASRRWHEVNQKLDLLKNAIQCSTMAGLDYPVFNFPPPAHGRRLAALSYTASARMSARLRAFKAGSSRRGPRLDS